MKLGLTPEGKKSERLCLINDTEKNIQKYTKTNFNILLTVHQQYIYLLTLWGRNYFFFNFSTLSI